MKKELTSFSAETFGGETYTFNVRENTIECPKLNVFGITTIELKPRFVMYCTNNRYYRYNAPAVHDKESHYLICAYNIEENLFRRLKEKGMIMYSTDMAYFYNFKDKEGFDSKSKSAPFKWAGKKGPILVKQKSGIFNR